MSERRGAAGRRGRTRPVRIDGRDYLTTAQVATYLGVRTQTVYAYVSRGVLSRTTIRGQRGSFFALAEVEAMAARSRAPRAAPAAERIHTQITLVDPNGRLAYRGVDVPALVRAGAGFEEACALLWQVGARRGTAISTPLDAGSAKGASLTSTDAPLRAAAPAEGGRDRDTPAAPSVEEGPDGGGARPAGAAAGTGEGAAISTPLDGGVHGDEPLTSSDEDARGLRPAEGGRERATSEVSGAPLADESGGPAGGGEKSAAVGGSITAGDAPGRVGGSVRCVADPAEVAAAVRVAQCLPVRARSVDVMRVVVDVLGAGDPLRGDLRPEAVTAVAERVLGAVVDVLGAEVVPASSRAVPSPTSWGPTSPASPAPSTPPNPPAPPVSSRIASRLRRALARPAVAVAPSTAGADRLVDAALALLADHDLAMSTRAARVSASAHAHPYAVIGSALGAMDSPLHGTAPRAAYRLLADALDDPAGTVADLVSGARGPAGFGHRIYRETDPRAGTLLALIREFGHGAAVLGAADSLVDAATDRLGTFPNSDFALAVLAHALDLRPEAGEVIFAVARIAGWVAHAMEEYAADPLRYRIAGVYTGVRPPG